MNDQVSETLAGLIKKHGTSLVDDPRRLEGLLRDLCGENKREINALIGTLKLRVPADLLNISNIPVETLSARLIKRIEDDLGLKEELARWAISAWMEALLGIKISAPVPPPVKVKTDICPKPATDKPTFISSLSLAMVLVPGANHFPTGIDDSDTCTVVNYPYEMSKTQVTYEQWSTVYQWALKHGYTFANLGQSGSNTSNHAYYPVTEVNWRDCIVWCNALTEYHNHHCGTNYSCVYLHKKGMSLRDATHESACDKVIPDSGSKGFRLPSSMEWELAARYIDGKRWTPGDFASGATSHTGNGRATGSVAWYGLNSGESIHPVGIKAPNALGIHDMSGNVWEWCFDWYPGYIDFCRVNRGGSWGDPGDKLQVGFVDFNSSSDAYLFLGFRLVRTL